MREKILLYLNHEDCARLMIAWPQLVEEWKENGYLRKKWAAKYPSERTKHHAPNQMCDMYMGCFRCEKFKCHFWREQTCLNCCMCVVNPVNLTNNPLYANCFCKSHARVWKKKMMKGVRVPPGGGLFSSLSMPLIVKVLDCLSPFQQASLVVAFPALTCILKHWTFLWHMSKRYTSLGITSVDQVCSLYLATGYKSIHWERQRWCDKQRTASNHCISCLVNPSLLLETPGESGCWCVDHCRLHYGDQLIWETGDTSAEGTNTSTEEEPTTEEDD